ncbi:GNAT family N-acetyltransferase [Dongia sp.]|uniref:GNAT family N-acetyltransferase n=1 Tax=Dongia sp. TaxID=1977262 RepID=UPI0035AF4302
MRFDHEYYPGIIADILGTHARYYAQAWSFGMKFEAKVAADLAGFVLNMNRDRDLLLVAKRPDERFLGSIAIDSIDHAGRGAHLRWFIVAPEAQRTGLGKQLLDRALGFCRERDYRRIYLYTFAGLDSARRLYEQAGFKLTEEQDANTWGRAMREQRFDLELPPEETTDSAAIG